jgi:hypothetical protein
MRINLKAFSKIILLFFALISMLSCTSTRPYEITSPCVSIDSDDPWARNPCQRRPINSLREIA